MNINTYVLQGSKRLIPFKDLLEKLSKAAVEKVVKKIAVDNVDIVFDDNPEKAIKSIGIGGATFNEHLVWISIDPEFADLEKYLKEWVERTVAHELYHCLREYTYKNIFTLLEATVNEGLADHFDMEINQMPAPKWSVALNEDQLKDLLPRAEKEYWSAEYNHAEWFFGSEQKDIPKWAGYSIGFYLVEQYLKNHPKEKPSILYKLPAKGFLS